MQYFPDASAIDTVILRVYASELKLEIKASHLILRVRTGM
jgi:hypothetical protein